MSNLSELSPGSFMMLNIKISILILLFTICARENLFSRDFLPGYIVTTSGDTTKGFVQPMVSLIFMASVPPKVVSNVEFRRSRNSETEVFGSSQLKLFQAGDQKFISLEGSDRQLVFMELIVDGHVKLFRYRQKSVNEAMQPGSIGGFSHEYTSLISKTYYYTMKGRNPVPFNVQFGVFKTTMSDYFRDDMELSEKIRKGKLKIKDMQEIAIEYNNWKMSSK